MIAISPEEMTTAEKLIAIETHWNDLCEYSSLESLDWQESVLVLREQQRIFGNQQAMDWKTAKEQIRQKIT